MNGRSKLCVKADPVNFTWALLNFALPEGFYVEEKNRIPYISYTTEQKVPAKLEGHYDLTMFLDNIDKNWKKPSNFILCCSDFAL